VFYDACKGICKISLPDWYGVLRFLIEGIFRLFDGSILYSKEEVKRIC